MNFTPKIRVKKNDLARALNWYSEQLWLLNQGDVPSPAQQARVESNLVELQRRQSVVETNPAWKVPVQLVFDQLGNFTVLAEKDSYLVVDFDQ